VDWAEPDPAKVSAMARRARHDKKRFEKRLRPAENDMFDS
jgi:hypothetical protein